MIGEEGGCKKYVFISSIGFQVLIQYFEGKKHNHRLCCSPRLLRDDAIGEYLISVHCLKDLHNHMNCMYGGKNHKTDLGSS